MILTGKRLFSLGLLLLGTTSLGCGAPVAETPSSTPAVEASTPDEGTPETIAETLSLDTFYGGEGGLLVNSTLIMGESEAILVDAQYSRSDAEALQAWIEESGKTLTAIWITHAHPDHYFGTAVLKEAFPDVPVYATPEVVTAIEQLNDIFVANAPKLIGEEEALSDPVIPTAYEEDSLPLEGETVEILELPHGDTTPTTALYLPQLEAVVAGDVVYGEVHLFMNENATPELRQQWLDSLATIEALDPKTIVPGHQSPDGADADGLASLAFTRSYLEAFGEATTLPTSGEASAALIEQFPNAKLPFLAELGVKPAYGESAF